MWKESHHCDHVLQKGNKYLLCQTIKDAGEYIHKGIAKRSFDLGWKISPKFDLSKISASMENGLLRLEVPVSPESKPKTITIK